MKKVFLNFAYLLLLDFSLFLYPQTILMLVIKPGVVPQVLIGPRVRIGTVATYRLLEIMQ